MARFKTVNSLTNWSLVVLVCGLWLANRTPLISGLGLGHIIEAPLEIAGEAAHLASKPLAALGLAGALPGAELGGLNPLSLADGITSGVASGSASVADGLRSSLEVVAGKRRRGRGTTAKWDPQSGGVTASSSLGLGLDASLGGLPGVLGAANIANGLINVAENSVGNAVSTAANLATGLSGHLIGPELGLLGGGLLGGALGGLGGIGGIGGIGAGIGGGAAGGAASTTSQTTTTSTTSTAGGAGGGLGAGLGGVGGAGGASTSTASTTSTTSSENVGGVGGLGGGIGGIGGIGGFGGGFGGAGGFYPQYGGGYGGFGGPGLVGAGGASSSAAASAAGGAGVGGPMVGNLAGAAAMSGAAGLAGGVGPVPDLVGVGGVVGGSGVLGGFGVPIGGGPGPVLPAPLGLAPGAGMVDRAGLAAEALASVGAESSVAGEEMIAHGVNNAASAALASNAYRQAKLASARDRVNIAGTVQNSARISDAAIATHDAATKAEDSLLASEVAIDSAATVLDSDAAYIPPVTNSLLRSLPYGRLSIRNIVPKPLTYPGALLPDVWLNGAPVNYQTVPFGASPYGPGLAGVDYNAFGAQGAVGVGVGVAGRAGVGIGGMPYVANNGVPLNDMVTDPTFAYYLAKPCCWAKLYGVYGRSILPYLANGQLEAMDEVALTNYLAQLQEASAGSTTYTGYGLNNFVPMLTGTVSEANLLPTTTLGTTYPIGSALVIEPRDSFFQDYIDSASSRQNFDERSQ